MVHWSHVLSNAIWDETIWRWRKSGKSITKQYHAESKGSENPLTASNLHWM